MKTTRRGKAAAVVAASAIAATSPMPIKAGVVTVQQAEVIKTQERHRPLVHTHRLATSLKTLLQENASDRLTAAEADRVPNTARGDVCFIAADPQRPGKQALFKFERRSGVSTVVDAQMFRQLVQANPDALAFVIPSGSIMPV